MPIDHIFDVDTNLDEELVKLLEETVKNIHAFAERNRKEKQQHE